VAILGEGAPVKARQVFRFFWRGAHALIISQEHLQHLLMFLGRFLHRLLSRGYSAKSGSINGVTMVFGVWFFRIRGVDKKVVVVVTHVTCRNEQMAETESGKFPYFWLCSVQFDQYPVSVFEGPKLFFACGGACFELAEIFNKCDARIHADTFHGILLFSVFAGTSEDSPRDELYGPDRSLIY
jgi:hypothetical protein